MSLLQQLRVAQTLFVTDFWALKLTLLDKLINIGIWAAITIYVNGYLLPQMGIASNFGLIVFGGILAAAGMFEGYSTVAQLVADLLHEKIIYYYATLPISIELLFVRMIVFNAFVYGILTFFVVPLGKLLLWNSLNLSAVHWGYFFITFVASNLFFGSFALFTASFIEGFHQMGNVWSRFIFPLWFLGGFVFPWQVLYETSPAFACLDLANPFIYVSETYRIAFLGQEGYLNFWLCIAMICFFCLLCGLVGIKRFKKRCDFI